MCSVSKAACSDNSYRTREDAYLHIAEGLNVDIQPAGVAKTRDITL